MVKLEHCMIAGLPDCRIAGRRISKNYKLCIRLSVYQWQPSSVLTRSVLKSKKKKENAVPRTTVLVLVNFSSFLIELFQENLKVKSSSLKPRICITGAKSFDFCEIILLLTANIEAQVLKLKM